MKRIIKILFIIFWFLTNVTFRLPEKYHVFYYDDNVTILHPTGKDLNIERSELIHAEKIKNDSLLDEEYQQFQKDSTIDAKLEALYAREDSLLNL
jgi:thioredoxin-related protein